MKLSEAIRLGSMMKPQGFGHIFTDGKTCALGAAFDAVGLLTERPGMWCEAIKVLPALSLTLDSDCPMCRERPLSVISHLNDDHRWTREQIADWVEQIERAQEAPHPADQLVTAD